MFSNCHYHFLILINLKSMFKLCNTPMDILFIMLPWLYVSILNLKWINRNITYNEQSLLDSSFQLQRLQNYQTGNSTTRPIQQIISSLDNSFTCNVSSYLNSTNSSFQTLYDQWKIRETLFGQNIIYYQTSLNGGWFIYSVTILSVTLSF